MVALGYAYFLRTSQITKSLLITVVCLFLITQGGGAATYVLRSDHTWYWNNHAIITLNSGLRKILSAMAIGG
jgi:hypothetical protein